MRHIRTFILLIIWAVPVCALLVLAFSKSSVTDLKDAVYIVSNDSVELELEVADGNFRSNQLLNRKTKEKLFLSGEEFSLKAGLKTKLGWYEVDGKPRFGLKPPHVITPDKCYPVEMNKGKGKTSFLLYYPALSLSIRLNYYFLKGGLRFKRTLVQAVSALLPSGHFPLYGLLLRNKRAQASRHPSHYRQDPGGRHALLPELRFPKFRNFPLKGRFW